MTANSPFFEFLELPFNECKCLNQQILTLSNIKPGNIHYFFGRAICNLRVLWNCIRQTKHRFGRQSWDKLMHHIHVLRHQNLYWCQTSSFFGECLQKGLSQWIGMNHRDNRNPTPKGTSYGHPSLNLRTNKDIRQAPMTKRFSNFCAIAGIVKLNPE